MKKIFALIISLCLVSLCLFACGNDDSDGASGQNPSNNSSLTPALNFSFTDPQGKSYSLSQMLDKPVVLNFWASWCPPCKSEMPDFEKLYAIYGERVNFVMVSVDDTMADATAFIEGTSYTFPYYHDNTGYGSYLYNVTSIPRTYFISKDGYIVSSCLTMITEAQLTEGIEALLTTQN